MRRIKILQRIILHIVTLTLAALSMQINAQAAPTNETTELKWSMRIGDSPVSDGGEYLWITTPSTEWSATERTHMKHSWESSFLWLRCILPDELRDDWILHIRGLDSAMEVFVAEKQVFRVGDLNAGAQPLGWGSFSVPLPSDAAGKTLHLRIFSQHSNIGAFQPRVGPGLQVIADVRRVGLFAWFVVVAAFLASLIIFATSLVNRDQPQLLSLSVICLAAASWIFVYLTDVPGLLSTDLRSWNQLALISFSGGSWAFIRFQRQIFGPGRWNIIRYLEILNLFNLSVTTVLVVSSVSFNSLTNFTQALALTTIVASVTQVAYQVNKGNTEAKILGLGLIAMALGATASVLNSLDLIHQIPPTLPPSVMIFLGTMIAIVVGRVMQEHRLVKQMATDLKQKNDELSRLDSLKDEFLANTSHELRTPLNGIIGISDSLLEGAAGKLSSKVHENLELISQSGRRLANLVNDILDFSKLRSHNIEINRTPVCLHEVVNLVTTTSTPMIEGKDVVIHNLIETNLPPVSADINRLQQILFNLVGNAIKFTHHGTVTISAAQINDTIEISIADTGIGIPAEKHASIFLSFEQGDGSTAREYGGTGLGLSITKHLIEMHGGSISLHSEVGKGSTFTFCLPVSTDHDLVSQQHHHNLALVQQKSNNTSSNEVEDELDTPIDIQNGIRILVVDDEAVNRRVLTNILGKRGYEVITANDGHEALAKVVEFAPHLVLLDVMMPRMSGYEVCRSIRKHHAAEHLPIILLTAKNQIANLIEGFESGANDYLTKPFLTNELLARVSFQLDLAGAVSDLLVLVEGIRELSRSQDRRGACLAAAAHLRRLRVFADSGFDLYFGVEGENSIDSYHHYHFPSNHAYSDREKSDGIVKKTNNGHVSNVPWHTQDTSHPFCRDGSLIVPIVYADGTLSALFVTATRPDLAEILDPRTTVLLESLASFLAVLLQTFSYFEILNRELTEQNTRLEQMVNERTRDLVSSQNSLKVALRDLQDSTQRLRSVFANVNQGILALDDKLTILPGYSLASNDIFEVDDCAGRTLWELVFARSQLDAAEQTRIRDVLAVTLGESRITYQVNRSSLPRNLTLTRHDGNSRQLELDWIPLFSEEILTGIMLTVRDVTEHRQLVQQAKDERENSEILLEIVSTGIDLFDSFTRETERTLADWRERLSRLQELDQDSRAALFHDVHTLKGSARTQNLTLLVAAIHATEDALINAADAFDSLSTAQTEILAIARVLRRYTTARNEKLRVPRNDDPERNRILDHTLGELIRLQTVSRGSAAEGALARIAHDLMQLRYPTLSGCFNACRSLGEQLANQQGFSHFEFVVQGDTERILDVEISYALREALMHFVRNSLTHATNTQEGLRIEIVTTETTSEIILTYKDSGAGLDLTTLTEKGRRTGALAQNATPEEVAALIFKDFISTAPQITDLAGRGVGMGAARSLLARHGASTLIILGKAREQGRREFTIQIRLPIAIARNWEEFLRAS